MKKSDKYCCRNCGSFAVQQQAWIDPNTYKYMDSVDESPTYCTDCEEHTKLVTYQEFKDNQHNNEK